MKVIIPSAGCGTRFGAGIPKALIKVLGKPIIQWQLEAIPNYFEVSVVVGFKGKEVEKIARKIRPNVNIVYNKDYKTTSVCKSIHLAIDRLEKIMIMDGDLVPYSKTSLLSFLNDIDYFVGIRSKTNDPHPVYVELGGLYNSDILSFSRNKKSNYEWACICLIPSNIINPEDNFIYESLERVLPLKGCFTKIHEVDTKENLIEAEKWFKAMKKR